MSLETLPPIMFRNSNQMLCIEIKFKPNSTPVKVIHTIRPRNRLLATSSLTIVRVMFTMILTSPTIIWMNPASTCRQRILEPKWGAFMKEKPRKLTAIWPKPQQTRCPQLHTSYHNSSQAFSNLKTSHNEKHTLSSSFTVKLRCAKHGKEASATLEKT